MKAPVPFILSRVALVAMLVFFCSSSSAATLYTTFVSGNQFDSGRDYQSDVEQETAASFLVSVSSTLDQIRLGVSWSGGPNSFTIYLVPDVAGLPGDISSALETWNTTASVNTFPSSPGIVTLNSVLNPVLVAGMSYWIILNSGPDETDDDLTQSHGNWYYSINLAGGTARRVRASASDPWGSWSSVNFGTPAFSVDGTAIPEPSTIGMGLLGAVALVVRRKWVRRD